MARFRDLTGLTFGRLTVLRRIENGRHGNPRYRCRCNSCGREDFDVFGSSLTREALTRSCDECGHCRGLSRKPDLLKPDKDGVDRLHRMIAAAALGKPLPESTQVHHVHSTSDNYSLVICPDQAYHSLIHLRERALEECGNPNLRRCELCRTYDDLANLCVTQDRHTHHLACYRMINRLRRWKSGKNEPSDCAAGLLFKMLSDVQPVPAIEITEVEAMALTERSLKAAGFIKWPDGGVISRGLTVCKILE
jgi:hypothetical protein